MTPKQYTDKYGLFFESVAKNTAINTITAIELSYLITKEGSSYFTKYNNFYAIAAKKSKKYKKYNTPYLGIEAGINLIVNSPIWVNNKLGTLKANPDLQTKRITSLYFTDMALL